VKREPKVSHKTGKRFWNKEKSGNNSGKDFFFFLFVFLLFLPVGRSRVDDEGAAERAEEM